MDFSKSGMLIYIQKLSTLTYFVDNSFTIGQSSIRGLILGFWGWGFQLMGFGACGVGPCGFFGLGLSI